MRNSLGLFLIFGVTLQCSAHTHQKKVTNKTHIMPGKDLHTTKIHSARHTIWESLDSTSTSFKYRPPELEIQLLHLKIKGHHVGVNIFPEFLTQAEKLGGLLLHSAVKEGNLNLIESLIDNNADLNIEDCEGVTPVYRAIENKNINAIKMLLDAGANIKYVSSKGNSLLHTSVITQNLEILEKLTEFEIDIDQINAEGVTALYIAAESSNQTIIDFLLKNGPDINIRTKNGQSLLHIAVSRGRFDVAKQLIKAGIIIDSYDNLEVTPLYLAMSFNPGITRILLDSGANPCSVSPKGNSLLHTAVKYENLEVIKRLISSGANTSAQDINLSTPLCLAVKKGYVHVIKTMIELKVNLNTKCYGVRKEFPLHLAVASGSLESVQALLDGGSKTYILNDTGFTPLVMAIFENKKEMITLLSKKSINIVYKINGEENTPLHLAVSVNNLLGAEKILAFNATVDAVNINGLTPLCIASQRNSKRMISLLVKYGANLNFQTAFGDTPLHLAVLSKRISAIATLCELGADIELANKNGWTPLCIAIAMNTSNIINGLLVKGSNPNAICRDTSPYLLAINNSTLTTLIRLTTQGAETTEDLKNLTHRAVKSDNAKIVNYFIGQNRNASEKWLNELLFLGASYGSTSVVRELINQGAQINATSSSGLSPLWYATLNNKPETMGALLENGADLYVTITCNKDNLQLLKWTLLHEAAFSGLVDALKILLKFKMSLEVVDGRNWTPLHYAAAQHNVEVVRILIENGANTKAKTDRGELPVDLLKHRRSHLPAMLAWLTKGSVQL